MAGGESRECGGVAGGGGSRSARAHSDVRDGLWGEPAPLIGEFGEPFRSSPAIRLDAAAAPQPTTQRPGEGALDQGQPGFDPLLGKPARDKALKPSPASRPPARSGAKINTASRGEVSPPSPLETARRCARCVQTGREHPSSTVASVMSFAARIDSAPALARAVVRSLVRVQARARSTTTDCRDRVAKVRRAHCGSKCLTEVTSLPSCCSGTRRPGLGRA